MIDRHRRLGQTGLMFLLLICMCKCVGSPTLVSSEPKRGQGWGEPSEQMQKLIKLACLGPLWRGSSRAGKMAITSRLALLFLSLALLANSFDVETNPGPDNTNETLFPCGYCDRPVSWSDMGICCDHCQQWYHVDCQGLSERMYSLLGRTSISWTCIQCGIPNFSTGIFDTFHLNTSNPFDTLSTMSSDDLKSMPTTPGTETSSNRSSSRMDSTGSSPGPPLASSSPRVSRPRGRRSRRANPPLRVVVLNCQSVVNKKASLAQMMDRTKPDIVIGTESWLKTKHNNAEIFPDNFTIFRQDRKGAQKGGGVFIAISNSYTATEMPELGTDCELVWCRLQARGQKDLFIAAYYRPPSNDSISLDQLEASISRVANTGSHILLAGDFNLPHINWDTHEVLQGASCPRLQRKLITILEDSDLHQVNTHPTRNGNILDLLITNTPGLVNRIDVMPGLGDHEAVFGEIDISPPKVAQTRPKVRVYKRMDRQGFIDHFMAWATDSDNGEEQSVDDMWLDFKRTIEEGVRRFVPTVSLSQHDRLPWITRKIKRLIKQRDRAFLNMQHNRTESNIQAFRHLKGTVQREIRNGYNTYIEGVIDPGNDKGNKKLWGLVKKLRRDGSRVSPLKSNGSILSNPVDKAHALNEQFQSVFNTPTDDPLPDMGHSPYPSIPELDITVPGVRKLLKNLKPHKAPGPDDISPWILKEFADYIATPLTRIFRASVKTSVIPGDWKTANVVPIFKKGERYKPSNYRPVSLTSISCKLLEHIIVSNIMGHLEKNNILYTWQHGFRSGRSTETQLVSFVHDLASNLDQRKQVDVVVLDFSKAFDKVSHPHLALKLEHYGIRGPMLDWIVSFLRGRTQRVVLDGVASDIVGVTSGVPQGSVLGPVLFLLYINDLPSTLSSVVRLFADDAILYRTVASGTDGDALQEDLDRLARWETRWRMEFNSGKCEVLTVTKKRNPHIQDYLLHGQALRRVKTTKYLGVTISSDLNWNSHINSITTSANRTLGFVKRNIASRSQAVRTLAYKTLVRPRLEYCASVWDPSTATGTQRVEMIQRRAARYVLRRYHNTSSVTSMLDHLQWPTLAQRRCCLRLTLFYKINFGHVALDASNYVSLHPSRTRTHDYHYLPLMCNTNVFKHSFFPRTVIQWNSLPCHIVTVGTVDAFKTAVTQHVCNLHAISD